MILSSRVLAVEEGERKEDDGSATAISAAWPAYARFSRVLDATLDEIVRV